jgi:hypothetical protein
MIDWRGLPTEWRDLADGSSGVYFLVEGDTVAYIGRSKCLRKRVRVHFYTKTELRYGKWDVRFHLCPVEESPALERECIQHYRPPINIAHRPKSVEVTVLPSRAEPTELSPPIPSKKKERSNLGALLHSWRVDNELTFEEAGAQGGLTAEEYESAEDLGVRGLSGSALANLLSRMFRMPAKV